MVNKFDFSEMARLFVKLDELNKQKPTYREMDSILDMDLKLQIDHINSQLNHEVDDMIEHFHGMSNEV